MVFSSMLFIWGFLPITFVVSRFTGKKLSNLFLIIVSLLFYTWGEPKYIVLMIACIIINYLMALLIEATGYKKTVLVLAIMINLSLLIYFKYMLLLVNSINHIWGSNLTINKIALPMGISFYIFESISYVVDVYKKECKAERNILNIALYISFFPHLAAGPIIRYVDIKNQIINRDVTVVKTAEGIRRFIYGLSKKVLIANVLGKVVDQIYAIHANQLSGGMIWVAAICYAFQIYYDFSGYSDMAIGLAKMFGIDFKENFNYPYVSKSIQEFWQRWHISLSTWFKEYVYIPLGGNRKGKLKTYRNLGVVFLLTGIWHGASWNFLLWGIYHGFFQIIERMGFNKILKKFKIISYIYCMVVVTIGWVFFRIENIQDAFAYVKKMIPVFGPSQSMYTLSEFIGNKEIIVLIAAILCCGIGKYGLEKIVPAYTKFKYSYWEVLLCTGLTILCIMQLVSGTYNAFIYFRF